MLANHRFTPRVSFVPGNSGHPDSGQEEQDQVPVKELQGLVSRRPALGGAV